MNEIVREEVPVIIRYESIAVGLTQKWLRNFKRNLLTPELMYLDVDVALQKKGCSDRLHPASPASDRAHGAGHCTADLPVFQRLRARPVRVALGQHTPTPRPSPACAACGAGPEPDDAVSSASRRQIVTFDGKSFVTGARTWRHASSKAGTLCQLDA